MGNPNSENISVVDATVDGISVGFTGAGAAGVSEWSLDETVDIFDFSGPIEITLDFVDDPLGTATNTLDPYAIASDGNLGTLFSDYTLTVNADGLVTLTIDRTDFIQAGETNFVVDGRGDPDGDIVRINFICFAQGTLIDTSAGPIPVENLSTGDLITTMDNGPKALRWVGARTLNTAALTRNPHLRPITIKANALGPQNPTADLTVSPQHRILLNTPNVQLNFWLEAALAPAKGLVDNDKVTISAQDSVTYYHLLFDRHEIIRSNGTWTESLFPGKQSMLALDAAARAEVFELFPELALQDAGVPPAAPFLSVKETSVLAGQAGQQFDGTSPRGTN